VGTYVGGKGGVPGAAKPRTADSLGSVPTTSPARPDATSPRVTKRRRRDGRAPVCRARLLTVGVEVVRTTPRSSSLLGK
jgi:hypothetical protein